MNIAWKAYKIWEWYNTPSVYFKDVTGQDPIKGQKHIMDFLPTNENRLLVCAASGAGKTRVLAAAALWECTVLPTIIRRPVKALVLSGSLEQSKVLYDYTSEYIKRCSIVGDMVQTRLKTETRFKNGSLLKALPCSERAFYGKHVDLLIIDEAALKDIPETIIDHALSIVAPVKGSKLMMSSTPYEPSSRFVKMWEKAPEEGWLRINWSAEECNWIPKSVIEEARRTLSETEFRIRWKGEIVTPSDTYFRRESIKQCLISQKPRRGEGEIFGGLDWGFKHSTVLTLVQSEGEEINVLLTKEWKRERIDKIYADILTICNEYHPRLINADSSHVFENNKLKELGVPLEPISFAKEKENMLNNLASLLEHGKLSIWEEETTLISQLRDYKKGLRGGDDFVDSLMLAVKDVYSPTYSVPAEKVPFKVVKYL